MPGVGNCEGGFYRKLRFVLGRNVTDDVDDDDDDIQYIS